MKPQLWLTLCSTFLIAASAPTLALGQVNPLPPPAASPGSPSDAAGSKSFAQAPIQSPIQAPIKAEAPQVVTCTIMVPQMTYKTITVPDIVCRPEVRQKTITVCRLVPETKMVSRMDTVLVPEQRTFTQSYLACRMTYETVSRQVTVMVPRSETRQGTRTVCRPVAVQEMKTVCRDVGGWTTQSYVDCCGCTHTCNLWASKTVTEQVPVTVYKPNFVEEPYTYDVVVCHPEQRTITAQVAKPVYETKTRDVSCVVSVPKQIERQIPITTVRPVQEERVVNYTAMVPERIEREVQVPVCTLVPKQVSYTVRPPCGPGTACGW
jgi:hypothetical protein